MAPLSAKHWLDRGLKALAQHGFTALKAEPLAKAVGGISTTSRPFTRRFSKHRRRIAAELAIADVG